MIKRVALALTVLIGLLFASASPASARATGPSAVTPWIELELNAIVSHRMNPPHASRALAYLSRGMYLAALAEGSAGREDAVAGAASKVLEYFFPNEAANVDALAEELADPSTSAFRRSVGVGRLMIARAERDGSDAVWNGTPPKGPGYWVPTPPGYVYPPLEPVAGTWRTWNLDKGSQFRPGPPPEYGSSQFLAEMNEVYQISQNLTEEQKRSADYWADGAGTVTPPGHWNVIAIDLVEDAGWSTLRTARLFSILNTAQADAFIACWDAKFRYWSIRPITAIRRLIDPDWNSYIVTPPFPSYVSGHSTTSGAASAVLSALFPTQEDDLGSMAEEAAISRLYGGIHYRSDNEVGLTLGRRVGQVAVEAYHVPTP
jgi:hypothetical protein